MTEQQPEVPALPGVTRYRVREPVILDAIRWTGGNADAIREFGAEPDFIPAGCYVLKGVTGHVFSVDAGRFAAIYEPADGPEPDDAPQVPLTALVGAEARAEAAEAKLAEVEALCRHQRASAPESVRTPSVAVVRILAILGDTQERSDEKGPDHGI